MKYYLNRKEVLEAQKEFLKANENEIFKKRFKSTISMFSRYKNAITIESVNDFL